MTRRRDESGQMTVMIIGFAVVLMLLFAVVTDVSKAFLVRRDLDALADGAALAAANGLAVYHANDGDKADLDEDEASRLTAAYLDAVGNDFDSLSWSVRVEDDTVVVDLACTVHLPFEPPGWDADRTIAAQAAAEVNLTG